MSVTRQDAWSPDDDLILAEVTLRHIREGGTQLNAFEEVGERIGRTAAACGFRWNSSVRKKYEAAIQIAKNQRKKRHQLKKKGFTSLPDSMESESFDGEFEAKPEISEKAGEAEQLSIDTIIRFLRSLKAERNEMTTRLKQLEKEVREKDQSLQQLANENERLNREMNHVQGDYHTVTDDYNTLIKIMDRARKLTLLSEEEDDEPKARFKMDANGNLERVE